MSYDHYGPKIRNLDDQVGDLESTVSDLESDLRSLKSKFGYTDDLDYELTRVRDDISTVESDLGDLDTEVRSHIKDTEKTLRQLAGRLQLLEAHMRIADGAPQADLDTATAEQRALARTALQGRQARTALLTERRRLHYRTHITHYSQAVSERDQQRSIAIKAAGILASTARTTRAHDQAALDFSTAVAAAERSAQRLSTLASQASTARAALDADAAQQDAAADTIAAGARAEQELAMALRSRLAKAVRDRALMPMWFVTVLGPVPPTHETQEWMELAVQVMAYRLTFQITDDVVALGPNPFGDDSPVRADWHRELTEALHHR
ncbi:hypothetical protein [Streptomyces sp. NPDC029674]|uniref:hypothetical protein n=1 Tax=Streptomyces sp. NPDC029674 TaxID=3365297 RepID=UPI00384AC036